MTSLVMDNDNYRLISDNFQSPGYPDIIEFHFSPVEDRIVFVAITSKTPTQWTLFRDSVALCSFEHISAPKFSPDGRRLMAVVKLPTGKSAVWIDSVLSPAFDSVLVKGFTPNSLSWYCMGKRGKDYVLVQDGRESKKYDRISRDIAVDPMTNALIYFAAKAKGKALFVIDGHETGLYDYPFGITEFQSGTGQVVAFAERDRKVHRLTIRRH